jgi:hypothetical protein
MCPSDKKTDDYQYEDVEYYVCFDCPHLDVVVFPKRDSKSGSCNNEVP